MTAGSPPGDDPFAETSNILQAVAPHASFARLSRLPSFIRTRVASNNEHTSQLCNDRAKMQIFPTGTVILDESRLLGTAFSEFLAADALEKRKLAAQSLLRVTISAGTHDQSQKILLGQVFGDSRCLHSVANGSR